jgi:hypothetical protein
LARVMALEITCVDAVPLLEPDAPSPDAHAARGSDLDYENVLGILAKSRANTVSDDRRKASNV